MSLPIPLNQYKHKSIITIRSMKIVRFGNKKCYLMEDEDKGDLKKQLIQRWNIQFKKDYTFLTEENLPEIFSCKLYLNTFGHNYYLYFTKLNGKAHGKNKT